MEAATILRRPPPPPIEIDLTDFDPTPKQGEFLADRTRIRLLCGGLGSGKTTTGGEAFFDSVIENPGCAGMMVAPTMPMFWRLMQPAWEKTCPSQLIVEHNQAKRFYRLRADVGGQLIWYGSADNPSSLEGTNLASCWGDELRYWPAESWKNLVARLRDKRARSMQAIATSTPSMGWMEEYFNRDIEGRRVFRISTRENERNLDPGYIPELMRTWSERMCRSIIDGEFKVVEGQVYEAFDDDVHLVDWTVDKTAPAYLFWDFGMRKASVLFAQETGAETTTVKGRELPPESVVIFDELHPNEHSTERTIPLVKQRLKERGVTRVDHIFCDPAGDSRNSATGITEVKLLEAAFGAINVFGRKRVQFQTAADLRFIPNGVALVDGMLKPYVGAPTLYVDRALSTRRDRTRDSDYTRGIVRSLHGYHYPDGKDGPRGDHPKKDGVYDHCMDALRYGAINLAVLAGRKLPSGRVNVVIGAGQ